jgi:hypothetical protein
VTRAAIAAERISQIGAINHVLMLKVLDQLSIDAGADGHADVLQAINDVLIDEGLVTRAELARFTAVQRAKTDQELASRERNDLE